MIAPILVVCANGDINAYGSVDDAESDLESPDVESGEYVAAFDARGTRLAITVPTPTRVTRFLGITSYELTPVILVPDSDEGNGEAELRKLLVAQFPECPPGSPLADLVERAACAFHRPGIAAWRK